MNERSIFMETLDKDTPAQRSAHLDEACAGDAALRQRVEALLRSHEEAGSFLGKPAPQRLAEKLAAQETSCQGEPRAADREREALDFLSPSEKPSSLGRLGHYEILKTIGRGGMGVVLKAFDEQLHRNVAIKVMAPQLATNAMARKRFVREARAAAAVRNEHVIDIHAVEEANELPYLAMEYVAGVSLQERLDKSGPLQLAEILRIGLQTAAGLAAAHAQGLIHRDIKPSNILLENGVERVKITDFGLARAVDDVSLTQSGVIAGTPQYMSPEQARGEAVDYRTDLFSLGSVLYAMCTGQAPFRATGTMAVLKRVCEDTPRSIQEVNPETPDWLSAIIAKLQAKNPADRFQSAAEVADLLSRHLADLQQPALAPTPAAPPPLSPLGRRVGGEGRRRWAVAAALVLFAIGGIGMTEATGVTRLTATLIRILTPDGTLTVEVDPSVIAKGRREVIPVKLEALPAPAIAKGEKGAFVLLGNKAAAERNFDILAEAVQGASDGDIIEIRGQGPFITPPIEIGNRALTIRAAAGFAPVLRLSPAGVQAGDTLLKTNSLLVLEGLEFQRVPMENDNPKSRKSLVIFGAGPLHASNCHFVLAGKQNAVAIVAGPSVLELRNCQFTCNVANAINLSFAEGQLDIENCLIEGNIGLSLEVAVLAQQWERQVTLRLRHNTLRCSSSPIAVKLCHDRPVAGQTDRPQKSMQVEASANIFDGTNVLMYQPTHKDGKRFPLQHDQERAALRQLVSWGDQRNLYSARRSLLLIQNTYDGNDISLLSRLADWNQFWGTDAGNSLDGVVRFQGNMNAVNEAARPAEDFRLRPDSPGTGAGKDGKDLGADIDLVGPGAAYERWKKTPAYQQWLKNTGQVTK